MHFVNSQKKQKVIHLLAFICLFIPLNSFSTNHGRFTEPDPSHYTSTRAVKKAEMACRKRLNENCLLFIQENNRPLTFVVQKNAMLLLNSCLDFINEKLNFCMQGIKTKDSDCATINRLLKDFAIQKLETEHAKLETRLTQYRQQYEVNNHSDKRSYELSILQIKKQQEKIAVIINACKQ